MRGRLLGRGVVFEVVTEGGFWGGGLGARHYSPPVVLATDVSLDVFSVRKVRAEHSFHT